MKVFNSLAPFLICGILVACRENKQKPVLDKGECKPYFQFDHVDYFSKDFSERALVTLNLGPRSTGKDTLLNILLLGPRPKSLSDTTLLKDLLSLGFVKKEVPAEKFASLNRIFCERKRLESVATTCIPVYRDILVFKRDNQIVGTAKICFGCRYHVIAGTDRNTSDFGQPGDYEELKKLLQ